MLRRNHVTEEDEMNATVSASPIAQHELDQVERANATTATPVVFVHGLWLLPSSWANWADLFEQAGYAPLTPDWPDDPATVEEARANPDVFAKKTLKQAAERTAGASDAPARKPVDQLRKHRAGSATALQSG